jgi:hypothetical protein
MDRERAPAGLAEMMLGSFAGVCGGFAYQSRARLIGSRLESGLLLTCRTLGR